MDTAETDMTQYNISERFVSKKLGALTGKALVRVDINVPVRDGLISQRNLRFKGSARAIETYSKNGIIPIILSHQGRKGDDDYLEGLEQHARVLENMMKGVSVKYSNTLTEDGTKSAAAGLKQGEALLLKNVRDHPDEKAEFKSVEGLKGCELVKTLSGVADFYINDAPATMHRSDASLIGFKYTMPHYLGLQIEEELRVLDEMKYAIDSGKRVAIIFGGKKWEKFDYVYKIAKSSNVKILCGGVPGQSIAYIKNRSSFNEENEQFVLKSGSLDTATKLLNEFADRIVYPVDFVLSSGNNVAMDKLRDRGESIMDIGDATLAEFFGVIDNSETIIYAGPVGQYEKGFNQTIKLVARAMSIKVPNYTLGGNSADSMDDMWLDRAYELLGGRRITSGGSGLAYLADADLPVLKAFES